MYNNITEIQKNILDFIVKRKQEKGFPPSMAEIALHFGYSTRATVQQHLKALEKKGYIRRDPRISRGIEVINELEFQEKPVLGIVAAGNPLTIYPDSIDSISLPNIVRTPSKSFLLKVKGDSLKDAFIFNGDIVIVHPGIEPKNGQIVAAVLDDAAVIKRFFKKKEGIELHSENEEYKPILIPAHYDKFRIVGVVLGIYRSMDQKVY